MKYISREIESAIQHALHRGRSILLFGARQTGKTTLVRQLRAELMISLVNPAVRLRYEKSPALLEGEIAALSTAHVGANSPLVIIDEIQKVPDLLDVIQDLIDRGIARFVLTGSSARKLRRSSHANLLPGRVSVFHLDPLSLAEWMPTHVEDALRDGTLPGIVGVEDPADREQDLEDYVLTYLEEEIRAEAAVRNLGSFARFLELAAAESGGILNFRKMASEIGIAHTTIASYYRILEDCLIGERVEPLSSSPTRKRLTRSDRFLFFDLGVRRVAAREHPAVPASRQGLLFEQFVGMELLRASRTRRDTRIRFWRDPSGPEVDWIVEREGCLIPVEVKWTETPLRRQTRHVELFLNEYPGAERGYVVCRTPRALKLSDRVWAIPWQELPTTWA